MYHKVFVATKPVPKGRPRMTRRGRVYTPATTLESEDIIRAAWDGPMFEGNVMLYCTFTKEGIAIHVQDISDKVIPPTKLRGDLDNYVKLLMDGLNGVAWKDDKQVTMLVADKR
jgi:crossover junction endodeoxyribonuclease RusA